MFFIIKNNSNWKTFKINKFWSQNFQFLTSSEDVEWLWGVTEWLEPIPAEYTHKQVTRRTGIQLNPPAGLGSVFVHSDAEKHSSDFPKKVEKNWWRRLPHRKPAACLGGKSVLYVL